LITTEAEHFIDGQFRRAERTEIVIEAATENPLGEGPSATHGEIDEAVVAARKALVGWRTTSATTRAAMLERLADALESKREQTAALCTRETGSPIATSRSLNGMSPVALFRYYASITPDIKTEEVRPGTFGYTVVRHEPVGVVGAIVPWNAPQGVAAMKVAPALAAGCTVVLKAAQETALDARVIAEAAAQAGLPPGVLNILAGDREAGAHLVSHPGIDKVTFTGSTSAGRLIAETCGRLMRPVTLELGGKSAAIILDDADLDGTMQRLRQVSFGNNGQLCYANTRLLAPRSRYSEVVDAAAAMADSLVVGNPLDESVDIGPLVSSRQRDRVLGYIETGKTEGARLVVGGATPTLEKRGWYVAPTVFADVDSSARIAREEIFGPVLSIIPYNSDAEAVTIANDSEYGLGGSVWSGDEERAMSIAREIQSGTVGVNRYELELNAPYGGIKASGLGRELGPEGLAAYHTVKSIYRVDERTEDR
jgi:aldehyde dehydrogenase (NAD+)